MKIKLLIVGITSYAALALFSGCKKEETAPAPLAPVASEATISQTVKTVDVVKPAATQAVDQATTQVAVQTNALVNAEEQKAQGLIDQAKAFVADQKYQEALGILSQLANTKLTADQQKLVADLKAQIQSALAKATAKDPASALGGALGGKK